MAVRARVKAWWNKRKFNRMLGKSFDAETKKLARAAKAEKNPLAKQLMQSEVAQRKKTKKGQSDGAIV